MPSPLQLVPNSPPRPAVATIALHGAVSRTAAERTARAIRALPHDVRAAHLDLSRVRLYDTGAMDDILDALRSWSSGRPGIVSITAPVRWSAP